MIQGALYAPELWLRGTCDKGQNLNQTKAHTSPSKLTVGGSIPPGVANWQSVPPLKFPSCGPSQGSGHNKVAPFRQIENAVGCFHATAGLMSMAASWIR